MTTFIKVIAFDCEGNKHSEYLNTPKQVEQWLERHGLELFGTSNVSRYQMEQELRAQGWKA